MRLAVVGHVEWVEFLRVPEVPRAGEIVHTGEWWEGAGGGAAVVAVQLAKLAGRSTLFTALGDDLLGHRSMDELETLGVEVEACFRAEATRRAVTHVDRTGERTITVVGERLGPAGDDALAWEKLDGADAVFFTAGDTGALKTARGAKLLVATPRAGEVLWGSDVRLDVLVGSGLDPGESYDPEELRPPPRLIVATAGAEGGTFSVLGEAPRSFSAAPIEGPIVDRYGAGDTFAAGLTYALGAGQEVEKAIRFAARCAAAALAGRGPHGGALPALE
jgi:ribokinase